MLLKLFEAGKKLDKSVKCPICDEPIRFLLRFKDYITQFYSNLTKAKTDEKLNVVNFETKMKSLKYNLKYFSEEKMGEFEHICTISRSYYLSVLNYACVNHEIKVL